MTVKFDSNGLVPAIIVDAHSGEVLTLAYMNEESLRLTRETGEVWLWSRSRKELWHKGATSGNIEKVVSIAEDCDGDALVVRVIPPKAACHTGARSCFRGSSGGILTDLQDTIAHRDDNPPEGSYTSRLLQDSNLQIKKLGEEFAELLAALIMGTHQEKVGEAADLIYHMQVALHAHGVSMSDVLAELTRRHQ